MIMTPSSFSYEQLSSMKFKELQKLSAQFRVNKRWAKKQELIENLLGLKKEVKIQSEGKQEENEWRDGSLVFRDLKENIEEKVDRRLTFNVNTTSNSAGSDRRMTFTLPSTGKDLLSETVNSRETYDVFHSGMELCVEPLVEARATFELPQKEQLLDEIDPRATFDIPQNGLVDKMEPHPNNIFNECVKSLEKDSVVNLKRYSGIKKDSGRVKFDLNKQNGDQKRGKENKATVKTLTIPYARVTRRNRKEASKADSSPIKMSKKSINIKKSTRVPMSKSNLMKSPALSSVTKSPHKQTVVQSLVEHKSGKITQSRLPIRLHFNGENQRAEKQIEKVHEENNKENMKKISMKRLSKGADEDFKGKSNSVKVNFKTISATRTPLRTDVGGRLNASVAATPGCKSAVKPSTATKMPDFSKIHKRHFEQMDSLPEYLKKKEERVRRLFGIPQPGQQLQAFNKSVPVFRFQSVAGEKGNKDSTKSVGSHVRQKQNDLKTPQKEAFKSKLPPSKLRSDIKEENRSRIHGVRTNKRFELQMKLRNM